MSNDSIVNAIQKTANSFATAAIWGETGDAVDLQSDFVYELYVLFGLIERLAETFTVVYDSGSGKNRNRFPKKPAWKAGRPRFIVKNEQGDVLAQVCAGTRIEDIGGDHRAPDISVQSASASDTPIHADTLLIHDAKYRDDPRSRLTASEVSHFARVIQVLGTGNAARNGDRTLAATFGLDGAPGNCLVTNGRFSTESDGELQRIFVMEVSNVYPGASSLQRP